MVESCEIRIPCANQSLVEREHGYEQVKALFEADFAKEFFDQEKIMKLLDDHHEGRKEEQEKSGQSSVS